MTGWYSIFPSGPITLGNLTPVGQNSGQVGCRWPPNGHHLVACLDLPKTCQLWGPFWCKKELYVMLPQTVYTLDIDREEEAVPKSLYRCCWENEQWQLLPQHRNQDIEMVGGQYLIRFDVLQTFWSKQKWELSSGDKYQDDIYHLPWKTLTLSHNRRQNYQVQEEGSFFAEMTTLLEPQWQIVVKIIGDYSPPTWSVIGAGKIPVMIKPVGHPPELWESLGKHEPNATGAILLTGALWQQPPHNEKDKEKLSVPYPPIPLKGYAADLPIPWQSWTTIKGQFTRSLTPGEWLTPAGAVYLWENESPVSHSGPFSLPTSLNAKYHRDALGYAHLWLF